MYRRLFDLDQELVAFGLGRSPFHFIASIRSQFWLPLKCRLRRNFQQLPWTFSPPAE